MVPSNVESLVSNNNPNGRGETHEEIVGVTPPTPHSVDRGTETENEDTIVPHRSNSTCVSGGTEVICPVSLVLYSTSDSSEELPVPENEPGDGDGVVNSGNAQDSNAGSSELIMLSDDDDEDGYCTCGNPVQDADNTNGKFLRTKSTGFPREGGSNSTQTNEDQIRSCMLSLRRGGGMNLYTPLQRWEYEQGYPVDGVEDVRSWAIEVGLADKEDEENQPRKKTKIDSVLDVPKYGNTCFMIENGEPSNTVENVDEAPTPKPENEHENEVQDVVTEKEEEMEVTAVRKDKGKEPAKDQ